MLAVATGGAVPRGGVSTGASAVCEDSAARRIDVSYAHWYDLMGRRGDLPAIEFDRRAEGVVADIFALDAMGASMLGDRWWPLEEGRKDRFRQALTRALRATLMSYFREFDSVPAFRPADEDLVAENGHMDANYWLVAGDWRDWLTVRMAPDGDGSCGIVDLRKGDRSLLRHLGSLARKAWDDYSFPQMIAELGDYDEVVLADFELDEEGALPAGWSWRDGDKNKNKPYRVKVEDGNRYLEATDEGESVILGYEIKWDMNEYPYIAFRVRVHEIPEGGDERDNHKVDSAAGLYFTYKKKLFGTIPESVKYVWSSTLPVGSAVLREGVGRPWQIVFGTGTDGLGEWRTYVFDLRQAYKDTFGGDPPSTPIGIGVLSDANSLHLRAYADYDDIRALRVAPEGVTSGVSKILPPLNN